MPQNLELKARVRSLRQVDSAARRLGARRSGTLTQTDTYYVVRHGRLKLREMGPRTSELIAYARPNAAGARMSRYDVFPLERPRILKSMLVRALGVRTVVRKRRTLYLYRNCRIHADTVRDLGTFVEFEVQISRGKPQAASLMKALIRHFAISPMDVVSSSYSDLLVARRKRP